MNIEAHLDALKESLRMIKYAIENGLVENQRTIGFNTSAAAVDLLEMYLHKKNLIDPGMVLKHDWFLSKRKIDEKLNFDFPSKKEIIGKIIKIESKRNILCYGKRQDESTMAETIEEFNSLKEKMKEVGIDEEL